MEKVNFYNKDEENSKSTKTLPIQDGKQLEQKKGFALPLSSESVEQDDKESRRFPSLKFFWKESYWSTVASISFLCTGLVRAYTSPALLSIKSEIFQGNTNANGNGNSSNSTSSNHPILISFAMMMSPSTKNDLISWIASMPPLASFLGTILSGPCLDQLGRRQTLFILSIVSTVGWLLVGKATSISSLLLGRALTGFACGLATATAPLYITEVCQSQSQQQQHQQSRSTEGDNNNEICSSRIRNKRGKNWLGLLPGILLATGILLGFILAHQFQQWQNLAQVISLFPLLLAFLSWTIPESPLWLEGRNKKEKKEKEKGFDLEMEEVVPARAPPTKTQKNNSSLLTESTGLIPKSNNKSLSRLLRPVSLLMIFQQFSGGNVLIYYLSEVLTKSGANKEDSSSSSTFTPEPSIIHQASLIISLVQFIGFLLALPLIDNRRVGQRNLLITSSALMSLAHLVLGFHFHHQINHPHHDNDSWSFSMIIRVSSLSALFCCYSIGMGPIPFLFIQIFSSLIPEQQKSNSNTDNQKGKDDDGGGGSRGKKDNKARSYLSSVASLVNHLALFAVVKFFPYLFHMESYGPALTFWMFAGMCWAAAIFTFYFVPAATEETSTSEELG